VGCLRINDMRGGDPVATRTCCHLISLDITQCNDRSVPKLSQNDEVERPRATGAAGPSYSAGSRGPQHAAPRKSALMILGRRHHSLKKMMSVGAIELAAQHAAVLEISGQSGTGMDRCDRASL